MRKIAVLNVLLFLLGSVAFAVDVGPLQASAFGAEERKKWCIIRIEHD